jgi:excisionase family DNA binding protein
MTDQNVEEAQYVTIDKMATTLGTTPSTLRVWVRKGHIPVDAYIRVGRGPYRFDHSAVLKALSKFGTVPTPDGPDFISIEALSRHLAVSVTTIRTWIRAGAIKKNSFFRVGEGAYHFLLEEVIEGLKAEPNNDVSEPKDLTQLELALEETED